MDGNGRWAKAPRAAPHRRARGGGVLAVRLRRGRHRARHHRDQRVRVLHRELAAQPRRGPLPHGLQPRRHPPPPRRDARARGAGPLGRPPSAAVAQRHQGARGRRGADPRQRRPHADDVRQLRRPGRDRRRRRGHRAARWRPGRLNPDKVDESTVARFLDEPDMPDVDLFVRSSGENRTSNFLLWQSAYAELVFLDTLWPDFDRRHLWARLRGVRLPAAAVRQRLKTALYPVGTGSPSLTTLPSSRWTSAAPLDEAVAMSQAPGQFGGPYGAARAPPASRPTVRRPTARLPGPRDTAPHRRGTTCCPG